eukprot:TRINITY_DN1419_c0_g2_i1.p1 TRINITY_DN1419_c0_g2~~TRINITY_DN1419_c0_g2_i1.p1  ORF type:complete len:169 (+),score=12.73 TRINITY_DN1419_c0_g2_i1:45-509(+)
MGALDYFSHVFSYSRNNRRLKKHKQLQTVEIKVKIDCEGCARKVKKAVAGMKGVTTADVDAKLHKLTVVGYVDPNKVLERVKWRTGKAAEFWPYVPYDVAYHPYAAGTYDKKAPPGYVRKAEGPVASSLVRASSTEAQYTSMFSEDNANSCTVM